MAISAPLKQGLVLGSTLMAGLQQDFPMETRSTEQSIVVCVNLSFTAVMITLLFLTFLFYYTPTLVLSSIIISAMLGLIDIHSAYHLWKVDKIDFFVCLGGYLGIVLASVEVGLAIVVSISLLRLLMHIMRPHTAVLGGIPGTSMFRSREQYPNAIRVPGILILRVDSPMFFATAYHQCRWNYKDEEDVSNVDAKFDEFGIPYDVLWLDIEHTDGKRYFTWENLLFPNPEEMPMSVKLEPLSTILA